MRLNIDITEVKGFLDPVEGEALYRYAAEAAALGAVLEVGSYCGKSTVYLGTACQGPESRSMLLIITGDQKSTNPVRITMTKVCSMNRRD